MSCRNQGSARAIKSVVAVLLMSALMWTGGDAATAPWGYNDADGNGPATWGKNYPDCAGKVQSPVNVLTKDVVYDRNLEPFDLTDYSITDQVKMTLENVEGHTAEVHLSGRQLFLKDGWLPARYILRQFHFHWGSINSRGSEHCINGKFFPMEVHFVHTQERFPNVSVAVSKPHGLAVLSFFFKIGKANAKYDQLLQNFNLIPKANDDAEIETFAVKDLIPFTNFDYYRYQGSLTTPPCHESVIWTLCATPIEISIAQLEAFRSLRDDRNNQLVDDFRPIQSLNQRTVTTTLD